VPDRADRDALVRGYAQALLAVAEAEGDLEVVEDELFTFAKAVEANDELRQALTDISLPAERKRSVVSDILGESASPHTVNILGFLLEQGRARELGRIIEELAQIAAERRRHVVAEVRSAVPLDEAKRNGLEAALSKATGRAVEVKVVVDPSVVGGLAVRVGDEVFDGTVRARLQEAKELLRS
jgi:F-type H+-transporting ATPase subunit delta